MSSNNQYVPPDQYARSQAIDPSASFIVSAPAGSGKTGLLTLRVLNLLSIVANPEEILCITFTRKAANEMRERIFESLTQGKEIAPNSEAHLSLEPYQKQRVDAAHAALKRNEALNWSLLQTPNRLKISTIDGFCKSLCNQLPFFSGLGTNAGIIENPEEEFRIAVEQWLLSTLNSGNASLLILVEHLAGNIDKLIELFSRMLSVRDQWLPLIMHARHDPSSLRDSFESTLDNWVKHSIHSVLPLLQRYEGELCDVFKYAYENLDDAPDFIETLASSDSFITEGPDCVNYWRAVAEFCLTKSSPAFRKTLDKRMGFPAGKTKDEKVSAKEKKAHALRIFGELQEAGIDVQQLADLKKLPELHYEDKQWSVLNALCLLLPEVVAYLKIRFRDLSATDYSEFSLGAVSALNADLGDMDLQQRLDYQIRHVLIDEFQDTSHVQLDLLKSLTREWYPDDGRTLFLVGDGMQSCYGFRNANVGIFLSLREGGLSNIDSTPLDLNVNFRSTDNIVHWVNTVFNDAFPPENDSNLGGVRYIPSISHHAESNDSYIRCMAFCRNEDATNTTDSSPAPSELEANDIVQTIIQLRQEYPEDSIAILAKSRSHLAASIEVLNTNNVPYQAVEIDSLRSKQHIRDLETFAKILLNPSDKLAWLACLRMPICGLNHSDLFYFFNASLEQDSANTPRSKRSKKIDVHPIELYQHAIQSPYLSTLGKQALTRFFNVFLSHLVGVGRRHFSETLELFWVASGGPEQLSSETELNDVNTFLNVLSKHEINGQLEWATFEKSVDKLYAAPNTSSGNPVQIMTMHKSKGLEFDSVFLPNLHKGARADDPEVLYWLERTKGEESEFILSPMNAATSSTDRLSDYIRSQRSKKRRLEETRILYVACTRTKKRLFISAELKQNDSGELQPPPASSLLNHIWSNVSGSFTAIQSTPTMAPALASDSDPNKIHTPHIKQFPVDWQSTILSNIESTTTHSPFNNEGIDLLSSDRQSGLASSIVGTTFHRILKTMCELGASDYLSSDRQHQWVSLLRYQGLSFSESTQWASAFSEHCQLLMQDDTALWVLDNQHVESECEMPIDAQFDQLEHGEHYERVIDRTFIDGSTRWLIDYKTSTPSKDQSLPEFFAQQGLKYEGQLRGYRDALVGYDLTKNEIARPDEIKVALYFPFLRHLHRLPALDITHKIKDKLV